MSAPLVVADDADLRRPFLIGVVGVLVLFVLLGGLIAAYGTGADRPEGVAERWLADVGDTRRDGVKGDATERADEVGALALAADLLPEEDTDGKAAFVDLEVGRSIEEAGTTRVPFRLHQRQGSGVGPGVDGTVVLARDADDEWRVVAVEGPTPGLAVPSEGGDPAAEAPAGLFLGTLGVSVAVAFVASLLVRLAGRGVEAA